jgi:PhnB protein
MEDPLLRLTPFLLFEGNCADAMRFYHSCFGGDLMLTPLADTPMRTSFPVEQHDRIAYAHLKSGTVEFSATDWLHPTRAPKQGNTTALCVSSAHPDELRRIFDKLSESAARENFVELREMPFGLYGRLTDRFGKEWFFRGERPNG